MQSPFSCTPNVYQSLVAALSQPRLDRYLAVANGDRNRALRLYIWNARICEKFYLPLQTAEICVRNILHRTLTAHYGAGWYSNHKFIDVLPDRHKEELRRKVHEEQIGRAAAFTGNHVVAGLTFGFWVQLLAKPFEHLLWRRGMTVTFPHIPAAIGRQIAYQRIDDLRVFRNKIAHHYAIFDRYPLEEYRNAMDIIGWTCPDTHWFIRQLVDPQEVMSQNRLPDFKLRHYRQARSLAGTLYPGGVSPHRMSFEFFAKPAESNM